MQLGELNPLAAKTDEARLYSVAHLIVNGPIGEVGQLKCCIEQTMQMSYDVEFHASAYAGSITIGDKGNLRTLPQVDRTSVREGKRWAVGIELGDGSIIK